MKNNLSIALYTLLGLLVLFPAQAGAEKAFSDPAPVASVTPVTGPTLEREVEKVVAQEGESSFVTLNVENDLFGLSGSDSNYTNGVRLTYHKMGAPLPKLARTLDRLVPMFRTNRATNIYYSIGQNLYTPQFIQNPAVQPNDRPWAGYLYGAAGLSTITGDRIDEIEGSLGIVGPAALGEQTQKTYHKWINSPHPEGWRHQLKNEPAVTLSWNRRWPERFGIQLPSIVTSGWTLTAEPNLGVTVGNVYTFANAGASFRLSPYAGRIQDAPIKVRPAMPGTGAFIIPDGVFSWNFFGGVEARAVARNIFLDGNTFTDSADVDKKPFVYDATLGLATAYGPTRISYAMVYRSREFDGQDDASLFGTVSVGYRF